MVKTYMIEDIPETDLNEWGYPNDNYMHMGWFGFNRLFVKRGE